MAVNQVGSGQGLGGSEASVPGVGVAGMDVPWKPGGSESPDAGVAVSSCK